MREDIKLQILKNLLLEVTKKYDEFIEAQEERLKETFEKATKDGLTGIYNRIYFEDIVNRKILKAKRDKSSFFIVFIDLDNFKYVNDNYGHEAGDKLLKEVVKIIKDNIREYDILARYGGDEFVLFIEDISEKEVKQILKRIVFLVEEKFKTFNNSLSFGISKFLDDGDNLKTLLKVADKRMYEQKINKKIKQELL